jgi:hypothetical protein
MELYPWSFDSIHSHCHEDVILILNILKNLGYRAPPRRVQKKQGPPRPRRRRALKKQSFTALVSIGPRGVVLEQSNVPTSPLDGVTAVLVSVKYFNYLN